MERKSAFIRNMIAGGGCFFNLPVIAGIMCIVIPYQLHYSQVILTEIMFDADTLESHNEYVELYNSCDTSIDLTQWLIGDASELDVLTDAGNGLILQPFQLGIILDASYFANSVTYDSLIPVEALIMTIDDGSFGRYGWSNTLAETVYLLNNRSDTVQSYTYSLNNDPGYSDEKIIFNPANGNDNWKNSTVFRGTPGDYNSVSPLQKDLAVDSMWISPKYPTSHHNLEVSAVIKNCGLSTVSGFTLQVFEDLNGNSRVDPAEILYTEFINDSLVYTDSIQHSWSLLPLNAGKHHLGIYVEYNGDDKNDNNIKMLEVIVESETTPVVINEIMFSPKSDDGEWIELYNNGTTDVNLENWSFADFRDTVRISDKPTYLVAGDYLVLASDSSLFYRYEIPRERLYILKNFPVLNNDYDDLTIFSPSWRIIDNVRYSSSWMRHDTQPGTSLERINPDISAMISENWVSSVDVSGATPAKRNSVYMEKPESRLLIEISPNPFSPDGDGFEDFSIIQYTLPFPAGYISIDIFDIAGRRIQRIADYQPVGHSGAFIWDGTDASQRMCRIGIYIFLVRIFEPGRSLYKELKSSVVLAKKG